MKKQTIRYLAVALVLALAFLPLSALAASQTVEEFKANAAEAADARAAKLGGDKFVTVMLPHEGGVAQYTGEVIILDIMGPNMLRSAVKKLDEKSVVMAHVNREEAARAFTLSRGDLWIVGAGLVLAVAAVTIILVIHKKRKN